MKDHSLEVHGCHTYDATGAISPAICLSATFRHPRFGESTGYDYGRVANPTRESLEKTVALLERTGLDDKLLRHQRRGGNRLAQHALERTGLDDKLLRLSVGIEDVEDLKADLQQALQG